MAVSHLRAALSRILRSPSRLPASSHAPPLILHSSAAAASSSGSFAAADYLVSRCGLTQAQALKAAAKISHLSSRARPDAVLAYLESTLRVPAADVTRVVVMDPTFLCADVEQTLARRVADLRDLGLTRDQIATGRAPAFSAWIWTRLAGPTWLSSGNAARTFLRLLAPISTSVGSSP